MKKPALYYSDDSLKALAKRTKDAQTVTGSTVRRLLETLLYDRWRAKQEAKDLEIFQEFVTEVFAIVYGEGAAPQDYGQALDDIRAVVEAGRVAVDQALSEPELR